MKKSPTRLLLVLLAGLPALGVAGPAQRVVSLDLCTDWMLARYAAAAQVWGYPHSTRGSSGTLGGFHLAGA